jgi:transcriptional regulator with XRE-family HTH domain
MPDMRSLFSENVRRLRKMHGWTQEEMARKAGIARTYYVEIEAGRRNTSLDAIGRVVDALDCDPAKLFRVSRPRRRARRARA